MLRSGRRIHRIALESAGQPEDRRDRQTIARCWQTYPSLQDSPYEHVLPNEEPLLSVADMVAWAYGAGGVWRKIVMDVIDEVVGLD